MTAKFTMMRLIYLGLEQVDPRANSNEAAAANFALSRSFRCVISMSTKPRRVEIETGFPSSFMMQTRFFGMARIGVA